MIQLTTLTKLTELPPSASEGLCIGLAEVNSWDTNSTSNARTSPERCLDTMATQAANWVNLTRAALHTLYVIFFFKYDCHLENQH